MDDLNIVFIVIDALRAENLSCYGYHKKTSPNIDLLAREGILFENAYACSDHTDPSFTTIFSGKFPLSHGIISHGEDVSKRELMELEETGTRFLQEELRSNGYYTIGIDWLGRWHKRGYDFYGEQEKSEAGFENARKLLEKYLARVDFFLQLIKKFVPPFLRRKHAKNYVNLAIKLVKELERKFFLLIHFWDTHTPFEAIPARYVARFREERTEKIEDMIERIESAKWRDTVRRVHLRNITYVEEIFERYNGAINFVDHEIGRLISFLKDEGLYDQTLIIITSDHGDNLLRDGIFAGHFGLYDTVIHVPLIMVGGGLPRGRKIKGFVQHTDIIPTILDITGVKRQLDLDGKSLLSLIDKRKLRSAVYAIEAARQRFAIRTIDYKYIYSPSKKDLYHKNWKRKGHLFTPAHRGREELYDLKADPKESQNIANIEQKIVMEMREKLLNQIMHFKHKKMKRITMKRVSHLGL